MKSGKYIRGKEHREKMRMSISEWWGRNPHLRIFSEERRKRMGDARRGRKHSAETKALYSRQRKGVPPWNKGIEYTQIKGAKHYNWKGGKSFEPYTSEWTPALRRSIRKRNLYICQMCGCRQGKKSHDVHHIDYIKSNCDPSNLITLCHKCHCETSNRGSRVGWIEYFKLRQLFIAFIGQVVEEKK